MVTENPRPTPKNSDLVITRSFAAPRELVWRAWSEPALFMRWWGPKGFTCPACKMDFRVGGTYLTCMRSPEGHDFWTTGVYREIAPRDRIVYTDCFADEKGNVVPASHHGISDDLPMEFLVTVTFEDQSGGTRMTLRQAGFPEGQHKSQANEGWNEIFDKMGDALQAELGQVRK